MKQVYDPVLFMNTWETVNDDAHVVATYLFMQEAMDHLEAVGFMALESSTGGWIDFPGETPDLRKNLATKIVGYYPIPFREMGLQLEAKAAIVQLAFPTKGTAGYGANIPMLLTAIAGNILEMPGLIKLLDLYIPKSLAEKFPGPAFGAMGVRKILGADERPLVNMMIKPKIGLSPEFIGKMAYEAGLGGIDHIKDDEMSAEVYNCSFEDRVAAVMTGLNQAYEETGNRAIYTVNVSDRNGRTLEKARKAIELGVNGIMVNTAQGFETLRDLAEAKDIKVPILFHPAGSSANAAVSRMVQAKLSRLCGADLVLTSSPWAKWAKSEETESIVRSSQIVTAPFHHIAPSLIVQSSVAGLVPTMIEDYGINTILGGGGAVHGHPDGVIAGVKAIRQAIDASLKGLALSEAAKEFRELARSLEVWPEFMRPKQKRY